MDQESTTQHLMNAARQGDLSPTQVEKAKSAAKGKKKQQKDNFAVPKAGVHTRRTLTKSNNQINGAKATSKKMERYRNKIGLAQAISNVSNKIWAFIDEVFEVTVMYNMVQQLTLRLVHTESHVEFVLTLIYAKCDAIERIELWDSLYEMARDMNAPWLVGGDFNFQQTFSGIEVQHLSKTGSDHSPMYLKCDIETPPIKKPFKFLNFWVEHATFKYVVRENWTADFSANPFIIYNHKLKKLKKALSLWSKATFGNIFQKISSMEEVVMVHEAEFEANPAGMNRERLQKVQAELIKCLALEEKFWQQKAGMTWFKEGDRNTNFFHAQVRGRRKRLQLNRIQDSGGTWIEEEKEIAEEAIRFCEEQFTKTASPSLFEIVDHVSNLMNNEQNAELIKQPTKEEVDLMVIVLEGQMEIVTDIRLRTKAGPNVILKLDMTKAYDRLSWLFLTKVMRKMGFTERLIGIAFGLVSNNWYSILINGQAHGFFKSSRGVKQGDPVSPTLFILAAEALSRGLNALHTNLYFCGFGMPK
ncbi:uncharacterized protein [Nicotiana sylvestris]|uniref:uncharacterized protein n=1 Tax=Nicotiana sylvestris TaxID=4096 RepID=UPI00388C5709